MHLEEADILLSVGLLLLLSGLLGQGAQRVGLPAATGYWCAGFALVGLPIAPLTPLTVSVLGLMKVGAGGYVLFMLGTRLSFEHLRRGLGTTTLLILLGSVCTAGLLAGALMFGQSKGIAGVPTTSWDGLVVIALALTVSSPMLVACVCEMRNAHGAVARVASSASVLMCAAVFLGVAGVAYGRTMAAPSVESHLAALSLSHWALYGCIGLIAGLLFMGRRHSGVFLGACSFAGLVALHRDASVELAVLAILLFAGIATANLRPRTGSPEELSPGLLWLAFGVVFGTTAALIDVTQVVGFLGLGLALVGLRALGLFVAARTTSWLTGNPGVVSPGFVALLPQAGFSLVLVDLVDDPTGSVHALALAVVLINALVMPLVLDRALRRAESATRHRPSRRHTAASFRPRVPNGSLRSHAP